MKLMLAAIMVGLVLCADDNGGKADTVIRIEGKTACGHCKFGIDEGGHSLAVVDKAGRIFILKGDGDDFRKFFDNRFSGLNVTVEGTKIQDKRSEDGTVYSIVRVLGIAERK